MRAALEASVYQTCDLLDAMAEDGVAPSALRVDGGMVCNNWMLQFLADMLHVPVDRPRVMETTALGAAYLAGRQSGIYGNLDEFAALWQCDRRFEPQSDEVTRTKRLAGWRKALGSV